MIDSRHFVLALALAAASGTDRPEGDLVPDACWDRLHQDGLLRLGRDLSGDAQTVITDAGRERLRELLA